MTVTALLSFIVTNCKLSAQTGIDYLDSKVHICQGQLTWPSPIDHRLPHPSVACLLLSSILGCVQGTDQLSDSAGRTDCHLQ